MIWVVTADSNVCRIYSIGKHSSKIALIKEISHPELKLKKSDYFTSDRPGHYQTDASARGAFEPRTDPKEVKIDSFSQEIARELNHARNLNAYESLILIMPPRMKGLLFKHLDKHVSHLINKEIQKDVMHLSEQELMIFIKTEN